MFLTISAIALILPAAMSVTTAQASTWSVDGGPSLFQTLGIPLPQNEARSQILSPTKTQLSISHTHPHERVMSVMRITSSNNFTDFPTRSVASGRISVPSPLTDKSSNRTERVGPRSASSSRASFVPQIAQIGGEADPILVAQSAPNSSAIKPVVVHAKDKSAPSINMKTPTPDNWGNILSLYARTNTDGLTEFDYAALKASSMNMEILSNYINQMSAQKPSKLSRNDAMAYWANLYNALTVQVVAQNYPVKSIRKIKSGYRAGPWKRKLVTVEGRTLSLDNIEHDILRPTYKTPLVHYMVNCASVGCPNLKATPWVGATLLADQKAAARAYINSPRGVKFNNGRLQVSSIYKWFKADFGSNEIGVLAHLNQFAEADLKAALSKHQKIDKYAYDWSVNAPK